MRIGVSLLPFRTVRRLAVLAARRPAHARRAVAPRDRTVWAVRSVAQRVPGATCLVQALAAHALLSRHGHSARLCLGVRRGEGQAFEAHAWVEDDEHILIGDGRGEQYSRLPLRAV